MTELTAAPSTVRYSDRVFFVAMAILMILVDAVGFGLQFLKTNIAEELHSDWVKIHVLFFTSWLFVFLIQSCLIASSRADLHRKFGMVGMIVAAGMILVTLGGIVSEFVKDLQRPVLDHFMLGIVRHVDAFAFTILVAAALHYRKIDSEIHGRLMFLATVMVAMRFPMLGRITHTNWPHYIDQDALLLTGIVWDLVTRGRVSPAYLWGAVVVALMPPAASYSFTALVPHLVAK